MKRIQRQRTKGWRMPEGAVYVGRPSRWGNPYKVGSRHPFGRLVETRADAVEAFAVHIGAYGDRADMAAWLEPLRGHDLACWCPLDEPCHADVLIRRLAV